MRHILSYVGISLRTHCECFSYNLEDGRTTKEEMWWLQVNVSYLLFRTSLFSFPSFSFPEQQLGVYDGRLWKQSTCSLYLTVFFLTDVYWWFLQGKRCVLQERKNSNLNSTGNDKLLRSLKGMWQYYLEARA